MRSRDVSAWLVVLSLLALTCQAQPPRGNFRNRARSSRDTLFRLLEMPAVRNEIELRPLQIEMLEDLQADLTEQRRAAFARGASQPLPGRPPSPEESDQAARERFDALRAAAQKIRLQGEKLVAVILDIPQTKRLSELRLQQEGTRALDRQEVRDQLQVNDEQYQRIQELRRETDDPSLPRSRRQKELDKRVLASLEPQQREKFAELQGEAFQFPLALPADLRGLRGPPGESRPAN